MTVKDLIQVSILVTFFAVIAGWEPLIIAVWAFTGVAIFSAVLHTVVDMWFIKAMDRVNRQGGDIDGPA